MGVSSSFVRQPVNVSGNMANAAIVYDQAANAPASYDPAENYQGVNLANWSDNFAKLKVTLVDSQANQTTHDVLLLPNSSESYNFAGRFIDLLEVVAVDEPVTAGLVDVSALPAAASAKAGLVDINLIEA